MACFRMRRWATMLRLRALTAEERVAVETAVKRQVDLRDKATRRFTSQCRLLGQEHSLVRPVRRPFPRPDRDPEERRAQLRSMMPRCGTGEAGAPRHRYSHTARNGVTNLCDPGVHTVIHAGLNN